MSTPEKVEVKKEKNDDVLADIMKDDDQTYEDEEMSDVRPLSITSPVSDASPPAPSIETELKEKEEAKQLKEKEATKQTNEKSPKRNDRHDKEKNDNEKGEKDDSNENSSKIKQEPADDNANALLAEKTRILNLSVESAKSKPKGDIKPEDIKIGSISMKDFASRNARPIRFFAIKTFSEKHLQISVEKEIWATQRHNESKLNDAYKRADVVLVFSVNNSRHFQGYALMTSRIGGAKVSSNGVWTDTKGEGVWGSSFQVKWMQLYDLPFNETTHIYNPLNEGKPVKICRDGTEIATGPGMELCALIDNGALKGDKKRKGNDSIEDETHLKRSRTGLSRSEDTIDHPSLYANTASRRIIVPNSPPHGRQSHLPSYSNHTYNNNNNNNNNHPARGRPSNTTSFPDRYDPHGGRGRSLSPPPAKRFRGRSPSPPRFHQRPDPPNNDRKRRDRDDEDRGRDRGRRDDRDRDRTDRNDRSDSPPPDILNMSYEDYLQTLAKYRRRPPALPGFGAIFRSGTLSERDYTHYMSVLSKQLHGDTSFQRGPPSYPRKYP